PGRQPAGRGHGGLPGLSSGHAATHAGHGREARLSPTFSFDSRQDPPMNAPEPISSAVLARQALARSVGLTAFVYGYPLTETYRTCALQTAPRAERRVGASTGSDARTPLNTLHHAPRPSTDEDRDVVTPANDLLYTMAWVHLAHGPMLLTVPAAARHPGRYFVLPLYDAYTENFENLGPRNCSPEGEVVVLIGPDGQMPAS